MALQRRIAVLVNRRAGRIRPGVLRALAAALPSRALAVTDRADDLDAAAAGLLRDRPEAIVLGGGDGTMIAGLAAIARASAAAGVPEPAIGVLALGTGNALARTLGARPARAATIEASLARARSQPAVRLPLLAVEGLRAPFCGFGVDARLVADADVIGRGLDRLGLAGAIPASVRYGLAVWLRSLPGLLLQPSPRATVTNLGAPGLAVDAHGTLAAADGPALWAGACTLAACATIPYFGFGLRMFTFARTRDDRFQVRAGDPGVVEVVRSAPAAFQGRYFSPRVRDFLCDRVRLTVDRPAPFEIAGDVIGLRTSIEVGLAAPVAFVAC